MIPIVFTNITIIQWSQAARQSVAVLLPSAVVVLKHDTSTLRQSHNLISIDFTFAFVITLGRSPALPNLVWIQWAIETPRGGNINGSCDFFILFLYSSTELQTLPVNRFSCTIAQKTRSGVRKAFLLWEMFNCEIWSVFTLKTLRKWVGMDNYQPK